MRRSLLATLALCAAAATPALAFDPADMSEAEQRAFGEAVRDYLVANPEVLAEAFSVLSARQEAAEAQSDQELVAQFHDELFNDAASWVGGNPEGDLTIVEFTDYRCPYCRAAAPDLDQVVRKDGDIRVIIKEYPILGAQSESATRFALSARALGGDEAYKRAHDALMAMKPQVTTAALRTLAGKLALDADAVLAGMDADAVSEVIARNQELGRQMNILGTPTFIVGDEMVRGVPRSGLKSIVDEVRKARDQG